MFRSPVFSSPGFRSPMFRSSRSTPSMLNLLSRRSGLSAAILLLGLGFCRQATALAAASIHPIDAIDSINTVTEPSGYISLNPSLNKVSNPEGYSHTTSVEVNQATGQIKGYSAYELNTAKPVTRSQNLIGTVAGTNDLALIANASGSIIYDTVVSGPQAGSTGVATVLIDVEGAFNYNFGAPALGLLGVVSITLAPGGDMFNSTSFIAGGRYTNFDLQSNLPNAASVESSQEYQIFDTFGALLSASAFPNVIPTVQFLSLNPSALAMQVSLSVPINNGDRLIIGGSAAGSATHGFLEDFRQIPEGQTGQVDAAAGSVDFRNTASLGIELPAGFALIGDDPPPPSIVFQSAPVPVPASAWFMLSALAGLALIQRRQRDLPEQKICD